MISTVFLVNWSPDCGIGGFQWGPDRGPVEQVRRDLQDPTATVHIVALPPHVGAPLPDEQEGNEAHCERITDWLDDQGWSDGGAHHLTSDELAVPTSLDDMGLVYPSWGQR